MPFRVYRAVLVSTYCFFIIHSDYGAVGESSRKEVEEADLYKQRRWSPVGNGPYRMVVSSSSTLESDELQPEESVAFLISLQEKKNVKSKPPEDMLKDSEEVTKYDFSEKYDKVTQRALLKRHRKRERYVFEAETTRKRRRNSSVHPTTGLPHTMSYNLYNHFRPIEQDVPQDAILPFLDFGRKLSKVSAVGIGATPSGINSIESSSTPRGDLLTGSSTEEDEVEDEEENLFHEDMDVTVTKKAIERNAAPRGPIQQRTQPLFTAYFRRNLNESATTERIPQTSPLVASELENSKKSVTESKTERQHLDLQSNESGIKVHTVLSPNYGLKLNKSDLFNINDTLTSSNESLEQHQNVNETSGRPNAPVLDTIQEQQSYTTSSIPPNPSPTARILSTAVVTSVSVKESLRFPRIRLNYSSYLDNSYRNNNNAELQRLTKTDSLSSSNNTATSVTIATTPITSSSSTTTTTTTPSTFPTELHHQVHNDTKNFRLDYFNNSNRRKLYTTLRPKTTTYRPVTFRSTFRRNASYIPPAVVHVVSTPPSYIEVPKIITYKPLLSLNRTFLPIHQGSLISNASTTALVREIKTASTNTTPEIVEEEEIFDEAGREQSAAVLLHRIVSPTSNTTQTSLSSTSSTQATTASTITTTILPPSSPISSTLLPSIESSASPRDVRRFLSPLLQTQQLQTRIQSPTSTTTTTTTTLPPPPSTTTTESPPPPSSPPSSPPPHPSTSTSPITSTVPPSTTFQPKTSVTSSTVNPALTTTNETPDTSINTSTTTSTSTTTTSTTKPTTTSTTAETFIIHQQPQLPEAEQDQTNEDDLNIHQTLTNTYHNTDIPYLSIDENTQIDVEFKPIETEEINNKNFAEIDDGGGLSSSSTNKPMVINDVDKSKKPDLSWVYNHKTNNSSSSTIKTNSIAGLGVIYQESPLGLATYILAGLGLVPLLLGIFVLVRQLLLKSKKKVLDESEYSSEYNRSPLPTKLPRVPAHINWEENKTQTTPPTTNLVTNVQPTKWEFPREKLRLQTVLGQGNFGQVWKAEADDICDHEGLTRLVAVKTVKEGASPREKEDLLRELGIMQELGAHPNVVTLLGCCTDKEPYLLIMEYVMYGKLLAFLREHRTRAHYFNFSDLSSALTSRDLTVFAYCVARGMEYLVSKGIIHRDLAARNILVDHNKLCKIADFGMSRNVRDTGQIYEQRPNRGALPIRWMAPESLHFSLFTHRSDVWSFGILLWEIITLGSTPYNTMGAREVMRQVREGYRLEKPKHCKPEFYKIVTKCWHSDPMKRPTFSELKQDIGNLLGDKDTEGGYVDLEALAEEMCDQSVH